MVLLYLDTDTADGVPNPTIVIAGNSHAKRATLWTGSGSSCASGYEFAGVTLVATEPTPVPKLRISERATRIAFVVISVVVERAEATVPVSSRYLVSHIDTS